MCFAFRDIIEDLSTFHQILWMFQGDLKNGACLGFSREALGDVLQFLELNWRNWKKLEIGYFAVHYAARALEMHVLRGCALEVYQHVMIIKRSCNDKAYVTQAV